MLGVYDVSIWAILSSWGYFNVYIFVFKSRGVAQLDNDRYKRWPNGKIPYVIETRDYCELKI